jgi:hypothetical protein
LRSARTSSPPCCRFVLGGELLATDRHNTHHQYFYLPIPQSAVIGMMLRSRMVGSVEEAHQAPAPAVPDPLGLGHVRKDRSRVASRSAADSAARRGAGDAADDSPPPAHLAGLRRATRAACAACRARSPRRSSLPSTRRRPMRSCTDREKVSRWRWPSRSRPTGLQPPSWITARLCRHHPCWRG